MDEEPVAPNGFSVIPPPMMNKPNFVFMYKTRQDIGHIATRTLRHARRIFVSVPEQIAVASTKRTKSLVLSSRVSSELKDAIDLSNEPLCHIKTVFPIQIFTDEIFLDRTKLTITRRNFFFSSDTMSIRIEDILNVSVGVGPFFGALTIATRVLSSDDHFTLTGFWRKDAIHMKHMIQGYVIARHNNIQCDHLEHDELVKTLTQLGYDSHHDSHGL